MKKCTRCGIEKELSGFSLLKRTGKEAAACKSCSAERQRDAYKNNPSYKESRKKWSKAHGPEQHHRKAWVRHNITEDQFNRIKSKYDGMCHVCRLRLGTAIDHDHTCCPGGFSCGNCVRGFLCHQCNTALGSLGDSREILLNAVEYLGV